MEREIPVRMTNFAAILNDLTGTLNGRNAYIERLCSFPLLILDDFGVERGTEYGCYKFYVDDGFSGKNFNRPFFQQMIADIESGHVDCVITKDLSRFGRNYLESGAYIEVFFPNHHVRYIAVNDGVDSANSSGMDITPFKNILN